MDCDGTDALLAQVCDATARGTALRIVGGDTKRFYGRAIDGVPLAMRGHTGILRHDPAELVLTARGGTPLAEVENQLAAHGQRTRPLAVPSPPVWRDRPAPGLAPCETTCSARAS
jgi:glycolate oxidase FAD binding subunit